MLALAAHHRLHLEQLDMKSAFPLAKIEEEVFKEHPEGFAEGGIRLVGKLNKFIYGLKQASKHWFDRLKTFLLHENLHQSGNDYCLHVKREDTSLIKFVVREDDIIVAISDLEHVKILIGNFKQNFKKVEKIELRRFLEIKIERKPAEIDFNQKQNADDLLRKQGMSNCNSLKIPVTVNEGIV